MPLHSLARPLERRVSALRKFAPCGCGLQGREEFRAGLFPVYVFWAYTDTRGCNIEEPVSSSLVCVHVLCI
jgi:hypothetical protein